jgi:hypothetical protein
VKGMAEEKNEESAANAHDMREFHDLSLSRQCRRYNSVRV